VTGEAVLAAAGTAAAGDEVDVAIRPEAIHLEAVGGLDAAPPTLRAGTTTLDAEVLQSAYLGVSINNQVRTTTGVTLAVVVPRSHERPGIGDAVRVSWRATDAMVLPRPEAAEPVEETQ
jgi:ABC-type Fe3+/spermidine/putrescine transport system ATPase subunit